MSDNLSQLGVAMVLASLAHHGQEDKAGANYIHHPCRVAERVKAAGGDGSVQAVAWLHDTLEDTALTLGDLRVCGFSNQIIDAVDCLTRRFASSRPERYHAEFIERIKHNPIARMVKIADLQDNLSRLDSLPSGEAEGMKRRYEKALAMLECEQ